MDNSPRLTASKLRERYGVSDMTLWRWLRSDRLNFPIPLIINGRRYWLSAEIEAWERAQACKQEAA